MELLDDYALPAVVTVENQELRMVHQMHSQVILYRQKLVLYYCLNKDHQMHVMSSKFAFIIYFLNLFNELKTTSLSLVHTKSLLLGLPMCTTRSTFSLLTVLRLYLL